MSRKYLDDNISLKGRAPLPSYSAAIQGTKSFDPGHMFQDEVTGKLYVNEGGPEGVLFVNKMVNRTMLKEQFLQVPLLNGSIGVAANLNFEIVGTNAADAGSTFSDGGGTLQTTAGASGDQQIITPHLDTKQSSWAATKWNTNDRPIFEANIKTAASIADIVIWAGLKLTNTSVTATDNDQAMFRFAPATNSGKFEAISSATGVDTAKDTGVTVAASTGYHLMIKVDAARIPRFYINGVLVSTGAALTANVDLIPYVGVQASAVAAKALTTRALGCSKDLND